jgi:glutamate-1-semialdehyde 2,1-aminomutase
VIGTYNDVAGTDELITRHAGELAAILVEPMLGSGGCVPAEPAFLELLQRRAREVGALLILDEVMTSRMAGGGLQARLGLRPDLTTLGKYVGGGMSSGAFGGRADVLALYDARSPVAVPHAGTFNNNVFSMAAGYAGLTELFPPAVADELYARGDRLRAELNGVSRDAGVQWTGMGSLMTAHFQRTPIASAGDIDPAPGLRELFHLELLARGFYLARRGLVALSLAVAPDDLDAFVGAVAGFVERYRSLLPA